METLSNIVFIANIAMLLTLSYMLRGLIQIFKWPVILIVTILNVVFIVYSYQHHFFLSLVYLIISIMSFISLAYGHMLIKDIEKKTPDIIHQIDNINIVHELAEEYIELEDRINELLKISVNEREDYYNQALLDLRNKQLYIIEQYNEMICQ